MPGPTSPHSPARRRRRDILLRRGVEPAMRDRTLITTGAIGAVLAAICCMTPLLVVVFGAVGLTAWLAKADYVLIPALILCLALVAFGLYRGRLHNGRRMHIRREPPDIGYMFEKEP